MHIAELEDVGMDLEREFDRRIAAVHGLDNPARDASIIEEGAMDIRHAEFQAMTSVFLGDDFDGGKLWLVESLQTALHDRQAELYRLFEAKELDPEEYVESFNTLLADTFAACEVILGTENFLKLFGAPCSELAGFIDREAFLQANQRDEIKTHASGILTIAIPVNKIGDLIEDDEKIKAAVRRGAGLFTIDPFKNALKGSEQPKGKLLEFSQHKERLGLGERSRDDERHEDKFLLAR